MSTDGIFIHYLVEEFKTVLPKAKINKIYQPNPLDIVLQLRNNNKTYQLFLSASLDSARIYLTEQNFINPAVPGNFCMLLRKYIERGIIVNIEQYKNDRLIIFTVNTFNEMGDNINYKFIIELMGRNSNIILLHENDIIIDALRKVPPSDVNNRYIIPKAQYKFPFQEDKVNPFENTSIINYDNLQGVSKLAINEIKNFYLDNIPSFIYQKVNPTIFRIENKTDYYCFNLKTHDDKNNLHFESLSKMLDYYFNTYKKTINSTNIDLIKQIKRLLNHQVTKLSNLSSDLDNAKSNLKYKDIGVLLQANLYLVKKGMSEIEVSDFLHDGQNVVIQLNPTLDPGKNLKNIFNKGKKASNALIEITHQIEKTQEEIRYLEDVLSMVEFATNNELDEIKQDLLLNSEQYKCKIKSKQNKKKNKIDIQHFNLEDVTIWIGKNNIQNDYLTNKLSRNNDYWFHVKDASGAHIVISIPHNLENYELSESIIRLSANLAAYFSKLGNSSSVPVDYTKIKYIKKIPGSKGYHVTYTNQKTIYIDPDFELIKHYLRK